MRTACVPYGRRMPQNCLSIADRPLCRDRHIGYKPCSACLGSDLSSRAKSGIPAFRFVHVCGWHHLPLACILPRAGHGKRRRPANARSSARRPGSPSRSRNRSDTGCDGADQFSLPDLERQVCQTASQALAAYAPADTRNQCSARYGAEVGFAGPQCRNRIEQPIGQNSRREG